LRFDGGLPSAIASIGAVRARNVAPARWSPANNDALAGTTVQGIRRERFRQELFKKTGIR
jgi:hypothetical protein